MNLNSDRFGYLANKMGSSKYFGVNNTGPCNEGFRIKLSPQFMGKLGVETKSGFTTYTEKNSLEILPEELATLLRYFIDSPRHKIFTKLNKDGTYISMNVLSDSYAVVNKTRVIGDSKMKDDIQEQIDQLKIKLDLVSGREKLNCLRELIALNEKLIEILSAEILSDEMES